MVTALPASLPCLVKAIYSWSGEEKSDLGFIEGDVIEVLNTGDGNWWTGRLKRNKMVGTFPCNFVEFIDPKMAAPPLPPKESTVRHKSSVLSVHRRAPKDDRYPPGHFKANSAVDDSDYNSPRGSRRRRRSVVPMNSSSSMRRELGHSPSKSDLGPQAHWDDGSVTMRGHVRKDLLHDITAELNQTQPFIPMPAEQHIMPTSGSGYDYYADQEEYLNHRESSIRSQQRRQSYYGEDDLQFYSEDDHLEQPPVPPPHRVAVATNLQADLKYHHSQASQHSFTSQPSYHSSQQSYHSSQLSRNSFDSMGMGGRNSFVSSNSSPTRHDELPMKQPGGYFESRGRRNSFNSANASPSPPVPIHHARSNSNISLNLDRTPSPLRNAMDDVIASLDDMEVTSQSRSNSITALDGMAGSNGDGPGYKRYSNTTITSEQRGFPPTPSKVSPRSHNSYYMPIADESDERLREDEEEEDDHNMPFDPNSYDSKPGDVLRPGAHKSQSSFSMSMRSDSTTPTTLSNASASSAGSLMRRKQESALRAQTGAYAPNNSVNQQQQSLEPHTVSEVPVKLPNARPSPTETKKQLPLKRSAGFLKKLFTGHSADHESQPQPPPKTVTGFGHTDVSVRRSKSKSSRYSTSSLKKNLRKVSSRTLGKSKSGSIDRSSKNTWIDVRRDVHRANTLTDCERDQRRQKRELEGLAVLEPLDALASVRGNETLDGYTRGEGRLELRNQDFTHVDSAILAHHTWPPMMSPSVYATSKIGRQFQYDIEQVRAIFDFCASKINIETHHNDYDDDDDDDDYDHRTFDTSGQVVSFSRLMKSRRATVRELAECVKSMCDALGIPCEIVRGHLKAPGECVALNSQPRPNHYWNAVVIDDQWRFLDTALASPAFPGRDAYYKCDKDTIVNHFYFLTSPSELIYSHIPVDPYDQHIVPPLNPVDALALPLAGPAAFEHNLKLLDYNTSITQLENLDVAEFNLLVPHGVDLYAEVCVGASSGNMYDQPMRTVPGLAQPYWKDNRRYVRVKGIVPEAFNQGTLHIYIGPRGQSQALTVDTMSLAYSIPLTHTGQNAPFEFVTRHTTPHSEKQDIYVTQPQCKKLIGGSTYVFQVEQHPSRGLGGGYGYGRTKLAVQSPSGKIHKLNKKDGDDGLSYGSWEATAKVVEVGTWRALVLADRGNAWSVFAEWDCV